MLVMISKLASGKVFTKKLLLEQIEGIKVSTINALINSGYIKSVENKTTSLSVNGQKSKVNSYELSQKALDLIPKVE